MLWIERGLFILATLGATAAPVLSPLGGSKLRSLVPEEPVNRHAMYSSHEIEYHLTAEQLDWVRPGLMATIHSVTIPADRHPVVEVSFYDDLGQPLDRAGVITPGPVSFSFILSWYDAPNRDYVAYTTRAQTSPITNETAIQASSDSGGSIEDIEMGRIRYTFGTQLPADYNMSVTHSVGAYITRDLNDIPWIEKRYYANPVYDFRPDGGFVTEVWDGIETATCNSCHEALGLHGDRRREMKLCMLCHNKQTIDPDTGNTVDMKQMIHKIHMGAELPSVQAGGEYKIIGFRQSVHDYSEVLFPQSNLNCETCHAPGTAESHVWYTRPSRDACGSCHDDINWVTGDGHIAGPQADDLACANCHQPEGMREFDASVKGAHTIPTKSTQLAGLNMEILDVRDTAPGEFPTVDFSVTRDDGTPVDLSTLNRLRLRWGGATTDYSEHYQEDLFDATVSNGAATYTLTTAIPADAMGSWAFTADVYQNVTIDDGSDAGLEVREAAFNPIFYAAVTDAEAMPRREVVSLEKCNVCHDSLSLHGGQRFAIQECVLCHNPTADDINVRPTEELPPESIDFKWIIHRIHTGHELENDFTVYGFRGSVHNYNHVGYPGDLRTCEACHLSGTYMVPLEGEGRLPTKTERDFYTPYMPEAASCNSCHSTEYAAAHAFVNTAPFAEACASCHGADREFSVAAVHAH